MQKSRDRMEGDYRVTRMRGNVIALNRTRRNEAGALVEDVVMYTAPRHGKH